jgi:hypothetical protein
MKAIQKEGKAIYIWKEFWKDEIINFMNSYVELAPKIIDYIAALNIFVAPFKGEKRERKLIEGRLAQSIFKQDETVNKFSQTDVRYIYKRKPDEEQMIVYVRSSTPIVGLPTELLI